MKHVVVRLAWAFGAMASQASCGEAPLPCTTPIFAAVDARTMYVGARRPAHFSTRDRLIRAELMSSDDAVLLVESDGVDSDEVVAVAAGRAELIALYMGCEARVSIEVRSPSVFADEVLAFVPGPDAGHGQSEMPGVVLGPPNGAGEYSGSLDVLSLGFEGHIELGFSELEIYDGAGPDLVVFENAFAVSGGALTFAEPGRVALGGGDRWVDHACDVSAWPFEGCAGVEPVLPDGTGGDAFDLRGLFDRADRVRVTDVGAGDRLAPNGGFDLDAIAIMHAWPKDTTAISCRSSTVAIGRSPLPRVDAYGAGASGPDDALMLGLDAEWAVAHADVVAIEGSFLRALRPGSTTLSATAGGLEAHCNLEVVP